MILLLIVFIFLTNFSLSVIRACIMTIILILSKILYRKVDIKNTLAISFLLIIIFNPYSIRSVSLQLSYLGTAGVIFITPVIESLINEFINKKRISKMENVIKVISVPIAAQIAILPIMVINYNTISLTFLISNILAIPILGISIIGGYLLTFLSFIWLWGAKKIAMILDLLLKTLILIAKSCANLKLSNIYVKTPCFVTIVLYYALIVWIIYFKKYNLSITKRADRGVRSYIRKKFKKLNYKKITIIVIVLVFFLEFPYQNYNGKLKIYFIDVGQRR